MPHPPRPSSLPSSLYLAPQSSRSHGITSLGSLLGTLTDPALDEVRPMPVLVLGRNDIGATLVVMLVYSLG